MQQTGQQGAITSSPALLLAKKMQLMKTMIILSALILSLTLPANDSLSIMDYLLGPDISPNKLGAALIFAGIGIIIRSVLRARKGVKRNGRTPKKFRWSFWLRDNLLSKVTSALGTVAIVFIGIRFSKDIMGYELTMFASLLVGLSVDYIAEKIKKLQPDVRLNQDTNLKIQ